MTEKLPAKVAKLKIPKTIGACADLLYKMQQERLALDKVVEAMKANETALKNHIIDTLPKGDTGAAGKTHQVRVVTEDVPQAENWEEVYEYVRKNKAFDLLQRRLNGKAVLDRIEDGKKIPGVKMFRAVKLSLTKVK